MENKKDQEMAMEKMAMDEMDKVAGGEGNPLEGAVGCAKDIEYFRKSKPKAEGKPGSPLEDATACVR